MIRRSFIKKSNQPAFFKLGLKVAAKLGHQLFVSLRSTLLKLCNLLDVPQQVTARVIPVQSFIVLGYEIFKFVAQFGRDRQFFEVFYRVLAEFFF